jgi:hypothetical protein
VACSGRTGRARPSVPHPFALGTKVRARPHVLSGEEHFPRTARRTRTTARGASLLRVRRATLSVAVCHPKKLYPKPADTRCFE